MACYVPRVLRHAAAPWLMTVTARLRRPEPFQRSATLAQATIFEMSLGLSGKAQLLDIDALARSTRSSGRTWWRMTPFGEFTRLGSQVEMSRTPESWTDPILVPMGSSRPEWLPKS